MGKIGRNDLCPCGSGKKYKKCCMGKVEEMGFREECKLVDDFKSYPGSFCSYDEVREMSKTVPILSVEQMSDLIDRGFEYLSKNDSIAACDLWFKVWEAIKYRHNSEFKNLEFLDKQYGRSFFVSNFCQDLEQELHNAGLADKAYFEKRICYCREFLACFPDEQELIIHNMRRAIAESYLSLNNREQVELEYKKLVQDYPDNPWGYIGWGDMYCFAEQKDDVKAKTLYEKGLTIAKDEEDRKVIQERLMDIK